MGSSLIFNPAAAASQENEKAGALFGAFPVHSTASYIQLTSITSLTKK